MAKVEVAIIGCGPRGLNVLEQLVRAACNNSDLAEIEIHAIDPGELGQGCHAAAQPAFLLTNTLASQVTAFSPKDMNDPTKGEDGPSFTDWARQAGYRRFGFDYRRGLGGEEIGDFDYLPRAMLGEYLSFAWNQIAEALPVSAKLHHHRCLATGIEANLTTVLLENGGRIRADYVIIATGHGENRLTAHESKMADFVTQHRHVNQKLQFFNSIYPIERLDRIASDCIVAMQGLGLTAYDAITALSLGRGGQFRLSDGTLIYEKSGREPKILLFSRHSLPAAARGVNQKGLIGAHRAQFLTVEAVEAVRQLNDSGKIDFKAQILPLLKLEMAYAYRCAKTGETIDPKSFVPTDHERAVIDDLIMPHSVLERADFISFKRAVFERIAQDLAEAQRGNLASPLKAAADVIRDLRAGLIAAIEHRGLTPQSHRYVIEQFIPMANRITFGPPLRRNAELLALIKAGIVDWGGGPGAKIVPDPDRSRFVIESTFPNMVVQMPADVLVIARVPQSRPAEDMSDLPSNLLRSGKIKPFLNADYHPCGIDIDRQMHPVGSDGSSWKNVWVVGFPVEGAHFHTHALPRPFRRSTQASDAASIVAQLLADVQARLKEEAAGRTDISIYIEQGFTK